MVRLVTGSSWVDVEAILGHQVSDTTLRARRDEWIAAGVFDQLKTEALAAFDRIVGLDLDDVSPRDRRLDRGGRRLMGKYDLWMRSWSRLRKRCFG
jgi:hypothetical protein